MVWCRWRGKSPSPARGYRVATDLIGIQPAHGWSWVSRGARQPFWSMGLRGAPKAPPSWGAGESEVSLASGATAIRCHPALTDPERLPLNTTVFIWAERRVTGKRRTAGGDATGNAPAGAPCQAVWYYHTQLAVKAKLTERPCHRIFLWCCTWKRRRFTTLPFSDFVQRKHQAKAFEPDPAKPDEQIFEVSQASFGHLIANKIHKLVKKITYRLDHHT
jgi:hypothetical protein